MLLAEVILRKGCFWQGESKCGDPLLEGSLAHKKLQESQGHGGRARKVEGW